MADWERQWPDPNESWAEAGKRDEEREAKKMQESEGRFTHPARMVQSGPLAGAMVRVLEPGEPGYEEALARKHAAVEPERPGLTDYERGYRAAQMRAIYLGYTQLGFDTQHPLMRLLKVELSQPIPKEEPGD